MQREMLPSQYFHNSFTTILALSCTFSLKKKRKRKKKEKRKRKPYLKLEAWNTQKWHTHAHSTQPGIIIHTHHCFIIKLKISYGEKKIIPQSAVSYSQQLVTRFHRFTFSPCSENENNWNQQTESQYIIH